MEHSVITLLGYLIKEVLEFVFQLFILTLPVVFLIYCIVKIVQFFSYNSKKQYKSYKSNNLNFINESIYYERKNKLISQNELRFYWALKKALSNRKGVMINCQTPMLSLLKTKDETALRKIWSKRVDFTITNSKFETLAVIELDDSSHLKKDRIERDQFVNKILKENHNLVRFKASKFYDSEKIKQALIQQTSIFN
tara:strand:+ start:54 stop:641 length:588 start_codon:yes stop_codon:yes gene_type:complete